MTSFEIFINAIMRLPEKQRDFVLDNVYLCLPPGKSDFQYWCTPKSAVTFATLGIDGVHYAILELNGLLCENSPVFQIDPTDSDTPYCLLADSFVEYLATGCRCKQNRIRELLDAECKSLYGLVGFVAKRFGGTKFDLDGFGSEYDRYTSLLTPTWELDPG
jgi:hypothetical protein